MAPRVLVTGPTGHLGSALVRALLDAGRSVRALVLPGEPTREGLDVEWVRGDVRDAEAVQKAVAGCGVVYHLAAIVALQPWEHTTMTAVNVDGARHVADAARAEGARMVHFGSVHAFRPDRTDDVVDESRDWATDPAVPAYDRSKAQSAMVVDEAVRGGLDAVALHPTGVIGPYDHGTSHQGRWLRDVATGRAPICVRGGFDWVDVRDVVAAALVAEDPARAARGEHFLLGGRRAEGSELAAMAARAVGRKPPPVVLPLGLVRTFLPAVDLVSRTFHLHTPFTRAAFHALDTHRNISHDKAGRVLGHKPRPLEDTVRDAMTWYREQGMLS